ncbi:MAG: bestrophin family ion channel [Synechococcales bacterium]|nr:bestrophin family ion channel [Synechococcales bacterium]
MASYPRNWFRLAFCLRGSVIPAILLRTALCGTLGLLASVLHFRGYPVAFPFNSIIPDLVLGLLLVFRTNTAYERFWEGRKLWGGLVNAVRNMARQIWIIVAEKEPNDRQQKIQTLRLLVAFAVAVKLHLRRQPIDDELRSLLSSAQARQLTSMNHPPIEIAFWIGDYLQLQYQRDRLNVYQLNTMQETLNAMIDMLGGCERILKTPIPLAYAIHLKQLLLLYCCSLPFQLVNDIGWWTAPVAALVSFTLFGIEEIGIEIEDPFGCDPNDLPLDEICKTMLRNIEDLITLSPCTSVNPLVKTGIPKANL